MFISYAGSYNTLKIALLWSYPHMLKVRAARPEDVPALLALIQELAEYEHLTVTATVDNLQRDAFGPQPGFRVLMAEWEERPAGYALYYDFYSSFRGRRGLFLEDLFVRQNLRGKGIGKALLSRVAEISLQENYFCMQWEVLDWNTPAIKFYEGLSVVFMDEWRLVSLEGNALQKIAGAAK
jgi:GNAT superfamily N-acetyltransferase